MKKISLSLLVAITMVMASCGGKNENSTGADSGVSPETKANEVPALAEMENEVGDGVISLEEALEAGLIDVRDGIIFSESIPVVADFYADWCGPCRDYSPIFHEVASKFGGAAIFISINTDNNPAVSKAYEVKNIPTTAFIGTEGTLVGKEVGALTADQLTAYINQLVETNAIEDSSL